MLQLGKAGAVNPVIMEDWGIGEQGRFGLTKRRFFFAWIGNLKGENIKEVLCVNVFAVATQ